MEISYNIGFGALAFVLTASVCALSFPLMIRVVAFGVIRRRILLFFFLINILMHCAWLSYLWPFDNLFFKIACGLQVVANIVFLMQALLGKRSQPTASDININRSSRKSDEE
jgi:hypothetical protein